MNRIIYAFVLVCFTAVWSFAGNPDRQGEAGAPELLMNPYAQSAGLHTMNTSTVGGVEAMRLNVAGLARVEGTEFVASYGIYLEGVGINMSAFGFARSIGENGTIGVSVMTLDFGDIPITTTDQPEGTGATFSPTFLNIGAGYAHSFDKVSVGILFRGVSERIFNLSVGGVAIDAGVQYVSGARDNFRLGISLRNIGGRLQFEGEGLSQPSSIPFGSGTYDLTTETRAQGFELQSVLNIGGSYDFYFGEKTRLTMLGNFTSNAFSLDQAGIGAEFSFNEMLMLRGAYKYELGSDPDDPTEAPLYSGPSAGVSIIVPTNKEKEDSPRFGIDYGYRLTRLFGGTHNIGVRLAL
jgi:hypothetical protein